MNSPKNRAIGKAARTKALLNALERMVEEAIQEAADEGLPMVHDKLLAARDALAVAHAKLTAVALALSAAFGESPEAFSGGDDKPEDPPEGP